MKKIIFLLIANFSLSLSSYSQTGWSQVTGFGSNPGNLTMYQYIPDSILSNAPLVVVLHGCSQTAQLFANESGWNTLADKHKFYVLYAEQQYLNNQSYCFNWFLPADIDRNQGEALSIKQMVDYMKTNFSINNTRIFASGLSAGASMTAVLLADYPEVFAAGAINAGCAYKAATDATTAFNAMYGLVTKNALDWGNLVRSENPGYIGTYPRVAIFQGNLDNTVNPANATELIKQWTNVHICDQVADITNSSFNGNSLIEEKSFQNNNGTDVVKLFSISSMGHAISIDPGGCFQQGGTAGMYASDKDFYSSFWAASYFGIINFPYSISGSLGVSANQTGISYSVPYHTSSTYYWSVPIGAVIVSGQNTNQITVNWGTQSGSIIVTETASNTCKIGPIELSILVLPTGIKNVANSQNTVQVGNDPASHSFQIHISSSWKQGAISIYDCTGKEILNKEYPESKFIQINNTDLPKGIYYFRIVLDDCTIMKKIILI